MYRSVLYTMVCIILVLPKYAAAEYITGTINILGGFFPVSTTFSGDIDTLSETIAIDQASILGAPYTTLTSEYLVPGAYTRTHNVTGGGTITRTATIPSGTIGAYFVIKKDGDESQLFNAWTVSADGTTFTNQPISGDTWIGGNYNGRRVVYEFAKTPPPPPPPATIDVQVSMIAGPDYECSQTGGHTVTGINASVTEYDGAALDFVQWDLDGEIIGVGQDTTTFAPSGIFMSLGAHTITATAFAIDGASNSSSVDIQVNDTVAPTLEIQFLDLLGNPVTIASAGDYQVHYVAFDVCDASVDVVGSATPVLQVLEGDVIGIISSNDVKLPTTAIRVNAVATDDSGRSTSASAILNIQ